MTILSVSKSDEGLYKCRISDVGESAESRLEVRGVFQTLNSSDTEKEVSDEAGPDDPAAPVISFSTIILHMLVGTPYLLSTIILGLIYRDSRRAHQLVAEDRRNHVIMEVE
ncbi:hypothetical protein L3Q82_003826 [Scortum barcoo]|uniref:Uncharacterized protein n=1 Tax=Scortum barcoo TaxID=214431 RepID=A0ACB8X6Y2_9TELE|nr:hypothetical protein L3Q82_003826 [Scortum barcoo]